MEVEGAAPKVQQHFPGYKNGFKSTNTPESGNQGGFLMDKGLKKQLCYGKARGWVWVGWGLVMGKHLGRQDGQEGVAGEAPGL